MILDKIVKIILNPSNINYYRKLGYNDNVKDIIYVNINYLTKGSHVVVKVCCDFCGIKKEIPYNRLFKCGYLKKYCCRKCKNEQNLIEKYGVKNVFQIKEIKEKIKEIIFNNYGVNNVSQSETVKEKKKETCRKNFGTDYPMTSEIIKEKSKKTCFDRYGVENVSKVNDIKIKKNITRLKNKKKDDIK